MLRTQHHEPDEKSLHIIVQKLPAEICDSRETAVVVIDVLRATSAMATAIANGAQSIVACLEIEEARQVAQALPSPKLLCGERHCKPIVGFDLGNSPREYATEVVSGKSIVMTTTNGTRAMVAASKATKLYAGAFVNLSAVAKKLRGEEIVYLVCAGTDGVATEEDLLFAGALIARLRQSEGVVTCEGDASDATSQWDAFIAESIPLAERLAMSQGGKNLVEAGYEADVGYCAMIDLVDAVPTASCRDPITLR